LPKTTRWIIIVVVVVAIETLTRNVAGTFLKLYVCISPGVCPDNQYFLYREKMKGRAARLPHGVDHKKRLGVRSERATQRTGLDGWTKAFGIEWWPAIGVAYFHTQSTIAPQELRRNVGSIAWRGTHRNSSHPSPPFFSSTRPIPAIFTTSTTPHHPSFYNHLTGPQAATSGVVGKPAIQVAFVLLDVFCWYDECGVCHAKTTSKSKNRIGAWRNRTTRPTTTTPASNTTWPITLVMIMIMPNNGPSGLSAMQPVGRRVTCAKTLLLTR
jgi:hypothetical protein